MIHITTKPIIVSHSSVYSLVPHRRNLKDAQIKAIAKNGMQEFYAMDSIYRKFASEPYTFRPPLSMVIEYIEYIIKSVGVDYVGLGSDFDGINLTPKQLNDVRDYPMITKALVDKGYSEKDIDKILGGNLLRVLVEMNNELKNPRVVSSNRNPKTIKGS